MSKLEIAKKFADLLESKDVQGLQVLLADQFIAKGAARELNKPQALQYLEIFFSAFPDHTFNFTDFHEQEGVIHCIGEEVGSHTGILDLKPLGIPVKLPPTGRSFKLPKTTYTFRVEGNLVRFYGEEAVEGGGLAGILAQLGIKLL